MLEELRGLRAFLGVMSSCLILLRMSKFVLSNISKNLKQGEMIILIIGHNPLDYN